jgi:plastocyanin domain-containing protein
MKTKSNSRRRNTKMSGGVSGYDEMINAYHDEKARQKEDEFTRLQIIEFNYKIDTSYLKDELRKCNEKLILNTSSTEQQQQQQQQ